MMQSFFFSTVMHDFMLEGVQITTIASFVSLCIGLAVVGAGTEGLKVGRAYLAQNNQQPKPNPTTYNTFSSVDTINTIATNHINGDITNNINSAIINRGGNSTLSVQALLESAVEDGHTRCNTSTRVLHHMAQGVLHAMHGLLSYTLMLAVMTFNAWLLIAVVLGFGGGYFLFGHFGLMLECKRNPYLTPTLGGGVGGVMGHVSPCPHTAHNDGAAAGDEDSDERSDGDELLLANDNSLGGSGGDDHRISDIVGLMNEDLNVDVHA